MPARSRFVLPSLIVATIALLPAYVRAYTLSGASKIKGKEAKR